jgi:hypothetical protein
MANTTTAQCGARVRARETVCTSQIIGERLRPVRKHRKRQEYEKEKDNTGFSMACPDTVILASTPADSDIFPTHRPPPFSKLDLLLSRTNR